ncbi:bifunctional adenosylcobinamide kinase/adenosylcobinamide-phosphate guanylyltransferase [Bradyrhizobium sp. 83012]|uniref:Bifunctional adenosylcobalamin biosynthesis protein n=1 Tax=Bradyrhizobium aeschynomenes TaxID=2734909 RepID=A0ABX2CNU9_9BRAD|nr:bifunctional adenosylcobinamide kinase/adenosylcobinamide-phosphate guanylyltransferase [Bradyrhizobium aeschynomenes]NPU12680.1 bifunctional adenosylcobinamide kinase/adenosylcobinamide-phosphate guanylyltransferase [Bradyrhizobium aeschynomenes]NPU69628.1 bifunctional adenosylcobinamide kinase/adenosylcobinamide-phosphate guanylyltransferase [Bradyrhizobium aeschynomenes]
MVPAPPPPALPRLTLVLGGARSGKSRHAEALVTTSAPPWTYVATAQAFDEEMTERIAQHKARRADGWQTLETTHDLAGLIREHAYQPAPVLIDCLTLWLSNVMLADMNVQAACAELIDALRAARGPIVAVSNEVGLGIVPDNALARAFRDAQGRLNQDVAALADRVILMAAGLPLSLK